MNIYQIVTYCENKFCGVVDYTECLVDGLKAHKSQVTLIKLKAWSFKNLWSLCRQIKGTSGDVIHVQYPSLGMGNSPIIAALPLIFLKYKVLITLHEFSIFNIIRKFYMLPYSVFATSIIFTNEHEASIFRKFFPWSTNKIRIVPIGTNIAPLEENNHDRSGILYFGQISEGKGIEHYLETVKILRNKKSKIRCAIVGAIIDENLPIVKQIKRDAEAYHIELLFNLSNEEVAKALSSYQVALLPFPGGVTDKRGSALACLANGAQLITTHGETTPEWWRKVTYEYIGAEKAAEDILTIQSISSMDKEREFILNAALSERQWPNIALKHLEIFDYPSQNSNES